MLNKIKSSLKRFLSNHNQRLVALGWRNEKGQRTKTGMHAFLNFLEFGEYDERGGDISEAFEAYVLDRYTEEVQEEEEDPLLEA